MAHGSINPLVFLGAFRQFSAMAGTWRVLIEVPMVNHLGMNVTTNGNIGDGLSSDLHGDKPRKIIHWL